MTPQLADSIFVAFLAFCRLGGCIMFAPGLSSARITVPVRLWLALAVSAGLFPLLYGRLADAVAAVEASRRWSLVVSEVGIGTAIGLMGRVYFMALQLAATAASSMIGLGGIPGIPLEEPETGSPLATLASSAALMVVLAMGLHVDMLKAVLDSYDVLKVNGRLDAGIFASNMMSVVSETSLLSLRLSAPFIAYGITVNFALGMANRFAPQISIYHASSGVVMAGGVLMLYLVWPQWLMLFVTSYESWLSKGGF